MKTYTKQIFSCKWLFVLNYIFGQVCKLNDILLTWLLFWNESALLRQGRCLLSGPRLSSALSFQNSQVSSTRPINHIDKLLSYTRYAQSHTLSSNNYILLITLSKRRYNSWRIFEHLNLVVNKVQCLLPLHQQHCGFMCYDRQKWSFNIYLFILMLYEMLVLANWIHLAMAMATSIFSGPIRSIFA